MIPDIFTGVNPKTKRKFRVYSQQVKDRVRQLLTENSDLTYREMAEKLRNECGEIVPAWTISWWSNKYGFPKRKKMKRKYNRKPKPENTARTVDCSTVLNQVKVALMAVVVEMTKLKQAERAYKVCDILTKLEEV